MGKKWKPKPHQHVLWNSDLENQEGICTICLPKLQVHCQRSNTHLLCFRIYREGRPDITQLGWIYSTLTSLCYRSNLWRLKVKKKKKARKSEPGHLKREVCIQPEDTLMNKREKHKLCEKNMWSSSDQVWFKEKTLQTKAWPTFDCHSFFNPANVSSFTFSPPRHHHIVGFVVAMFFGPKPFHLVKPRQNVKSVFHHCGLALIMCQQQNLTLCFSEACRDWWLELLVHQRIFVLTLGVTLNLGAKHEKRTFWWIPFELIGTAVQTIICKLVHYH